MRHFCVPSIGRDPLFQDVSLAPLAPGEVAVDLKYAALNHADLLMISGKYQDTPDAPFALGLEGAGVISDAHPETELKDGTRVALFAGHGCLSERIHIGADQLIPVPEGLSLDIAAALPIAFGTAHLGLVRRANVKPGETLLVTGAGGGAGLAAVRLGKALGLKVIASARSLEHREQAMNAGAIAAIDSTSDGKMITADLRELGPVDIVYDTVGGTSLAPILRAVRPEGRVILVGFVGGLPDLKPNHLLVKNQNIIGLNVSAYRKFQPQALKESLQAIMALAAAGEISADIGHRFAFDDAPEALDLLRSRKALGKVIIDLS